MSSINVTTAYVRDLLIKFTKNLDTEWINIQEITDYVCSSVKPEMNVSELHNYIAGHCASKSSIHPDFDQLATNICVDLLHSHTDSNYLNVVESLYNVYDTERKHTPIISKELFDIVKSNTDLINSKIDYSRDYELGYFGIKTLERSYLQRIRTTKKLFIQHNDDPEHIERKTTSSERIVERPQHLFMRVALGIHGNDLEHAFETYEYMSQKYFVHATPTLFNAGTCNPQMSSCFLLNMGDSIDEIFGTITKMAHISKWSGGIGSSVSDVRAKGSLIRRTNGLSSGLLPYCGIVNGVATAVNQGSKRNGSIALYLEPWHADVWEFCEMKLNTKNESSKCRDLFFGLWIPDLFMRRVFENKMWSLMCPDECPGLTTLYGTAFDELYESYELQGKYKKQISAVKLWYHILQSQIESGMPYILYKDSANQKSNQKNLGTIKCSNLCTEIIEYTDNETVSVCNLASLCLPKFIEHQNGKLIFNHKKLELMTRILVRNLDIVIDKNFYPIIEAQNSNLKHRPLGIGIQGLADIYNIFGYPFGSHDAFTLNRHIFETIYYASISESNLLAQQKGKYSSFDGSPSSMGQLQFHLWNSDTSTFSGRYDWDTLTTNVIKHGLRNSLLTTVMPTASTAQIMGNSESIDPYLSNVFTRSTLAGDFIVINTHLVRDLLRLGLWSESMRKKIIIMNGSIANIPEIPQHLKDIYKTAFEIKLKDIIQQSIDRGIFIDQSQSLNLFMDPIDFDRLSTAHHYGWKNGLKTGMYYLRTRPSVDPIQFGIEPDEVKKLLGNDKTSQNDQNQNQNQDQNQDQNQPPIYCTRRPGVKISECMACS